MDVTEIEVTTNSVLANGRLGWMLYNGYQSSDPAGHFMANGIPRGSWWTVGLGDARGKGIAASAAAARTCCTRFTFEGGLLSIVWCEAQGPDGKLSLFVGSPGTTWQSETVLVTAGPDIRRSLSSLPISAPRSNPPSVGWLSWYHYGPMVSREDVLVHAELLASEEYRRLGYRLIQVDDGWQQTYGEWLPNTKFPGGLQSLCEELRQRGHLPGLWTAPFLVNVAADLSRDAPDSWFVRDPATGARAVDPRHWAFGPMHVLDASNPAVLTYIRDLFAGFYDTGIRYFKVDFLYAGGYAGTRALRAGMEAIRDGARDAEVVASGAPLLPVLGLVEGCRVGPDTATPLLDFELGITTPTVFGDEVLAVARNVAARTVLHRWFHLDADVALVGGNLSLEQGRQLVTMAALSGGPFFASDDLINLPPERLSLLTNPEVLDLVGGVPAVPDWEPDESDRPAVHWRRGDLLAVFNWASQQAEIAIRAPGTKGARDLWARRELDRFHNGVRLQVPANGVRLLRTR